MERSWNRDPGWFLSLDPDIQHAVLADWNLTQREIRKAREEAERKRKGHRGRHGL